MERLRLFSSPNAMAEEGSTLITHTLFDEYFSQAAVSSRTSSNVFSALVPPLSAEEYADAIKSTRAASGTVQSSICSHSFRNRVVPRFLRELDEDFNLLFYGFGSKRTFLNQLGRECSKAGHVVVVNGFHPHVSVKDLLNSVDNVPGLSTLPPAAAGIEHQARRIGQFFNKESSNRRLYLVIHNIDAAPLRTPKARSCLSLLALSPGIHLMASVDSINAPLLWSSTEMSTRKSASPTTEGETRRGFAWLMHDLTTLLPYDVELSFVDRTSLPGTHGKSRKRQGDTHEGVPMTETAAAHILASVTQRARKLFVMMATRQLESMEEAGDTGAGDLQQFAIGYDMLFTVARDDFIGTNDTALRSLLGEFRDHGLVLGAPNSAGGENLWIPLRKERLSSVLRSLQTEQ
jgi:origin recognition complex subunit 2